MCVGDYKELFWKHIKHLLISPDILSILISIAVTQSFHGVNKCYSVVFMDKGQRRLSALGLLLQNQGLDSICLSKCKSSQLSKSLDGSTKNMYLFIDISLTWKKAITLDKLFFPGAAWAPSEFTILHQTLIYLPPENTEMCM